MSLRSKRRGNLDFLGIEIPFRTKGRISGFATASPRNRFLPRNDKLFNALAFV